MVGLLSYWLPTVGHVDSSRSREFILKGGLWWKVKNLWTAKVDVVDFRKGIKAYEDVVRSWEQLDGHVQRQDTIQSLLSAIPEFILYSSVVPNNFH
jgi:hypothetical protein